MHRTGHWLGMDVHDCGSYVEPTQVGEVSERKDPLSGELITEPPQPHPAAGHGADHRAGPLCAAGRRRAASSSTTSASASRTTPIVTESGCELISRGVPVKAEEIEALMRA